MIVHHFLNFQHKWTRRSMCSSLLFIQSLLLFSLQAFWSNKLPLHWLNTLVQFIHISKKWIYYWILVKTICLWMSQKSHQSHYCWALDGQVNLLRQHSSVNGAQFTFSWIHFAKISNKEYLWFLLDNAI